MPDRRGDVVGSHLVRRELTPRVVREALGAKQASASDEDEEAHERERAHDRPKQTVLAVPPARGQDREDVTLHPKHALAVPIPPIPDRKLMRAIHRACVATASAVRTATKGAHEGPRERSLDTEAASSLVS